MEESTQKLIREEDTKLLNKKNEIANLRADIEKLRIQETLDEMIKIKQTEDDQQRLLTE